MSYEKVALIGIGNIMFYDEGLGAYLVLYIEKNYDIPSNLTIVEGGTLGFDLMNYYQDYDKIIVVGTGSKGDEAGSICIETADEIISNSSPIRKTANEVEITMMIEICSFHENMGEVELISMVPEDILPVKNGLSDVILKSMPKLVETTLQELKKSGISIKKKTSNLVSFEEVLKDCANPKMADYNDMSNMK